MSQFVLTSTYLSSWLILPSLAFHILLHATVSAMDYTPNVVSKRCFSLHLSILGLRKGPGKFLTGVLESPGKVLDFFQWKSGNPGLSTAVRNNMHFVLYRYCYKGRYSVNIHLKWRENSGSLIITGEWQPCLQFLGILCYTPLKTLFTLPLIIVLAEPLRCQRRPAVSRQHPTIRTGSILTDLGRSVW